MSFEGKPISKEKVVDLIVESAVTKHDLHFSELEVEIVARIINQFPSRPNNINIPLWCNKVVSEEIAKYPDLRQNAETVRRDVGRELKYLLDKADFDFMQNVFKTQNITHVSPQYFISHFPNFYKKAKRYYHKVDGSIDWSFISTKLGIQIEYKTTPDYGNKEDVINHLVDLLNKNNPNTFNIAWLRKEDYSLYTAMFQRFKNVEVGTIDWSVIKDYLPEPWKSKLDVRGLSVVSVVDRFVSYLNTSNKISTISPKSLIEFSRKDYILLVDKLPRDARSNIKWQAFVDLLPKKFSILWDRKRRFREVLPENQYSDEEEVDTKTNDLREYFYLFHVPAKNSNEEKHKIELAERLILLAQGGNVSAYERLADHLYLICEEKIETDPRLANWKYAKNELEKVIRSCIYLHKPAKGNFFKYINTSLYKKVHTINQFIERQKGGMIHISNKGEFYEEGGSDD